VKVNDEVESKPVFITVNADIPKFVKNLTINKRQFDAGETLNFECTLNKPYGDVVWLKDGQPIEENAHVQFTKDGPKLKLTIKDAQPTDHTGTYSVQVKNVESDKVPVTVTKKVPKFVKDLKPNKTTLLEGEQLVLECELDTAPTTIQLEVNGEKLPEDRVKTEVKDKKIKFTLDNIKLDESGDFKVKVNDEVESKPVSITVNADIPKFVKNLTINKKQFDAGETLNFECTLNKPYDEVVWLKDGQPIEEDAHVQFTKDGPKLKLTIKDAQPTDHTGTYSVSVKEVESDKVPVTVTKKVPKFVKDLKANKTTLTEGEQLVLECELDSVPTDVKLQINGETVPEDRVKTEVKDKKIKFTLDNIKLDESGDFTVKVNDELESKPVSIKVNADIPKFVKNLTINKKQFDLGETLNFECTLNKPFDQIVWLKDGQPIEQDERIQFTQDGPKLKLTIKDAQPGDHTGTYSVRVKEVESDKVPVTVTKKVPKFLTEGYGFN
jgi:predicted lipoprotein with Yx(FWY)xxD motif/predicted RNA-binding protein